MAATSYATLAELKTQIKGIGTDYDALFTQNLSEASRRVDDECKRVFYADGASTRYFDGTGGSRLYIPQIDFFTVTALKIAPSDNAALGGYFTITGDGITPPSNFYLEPANPLPVGNASDQASRRPFYIVTIPATAKAGSSTDYQAVFTAGMRTVSITASWGWPVVPDEIKALTVKLAIRLWRARDSNFTGQSGAPATGTVSTKTLLDDGDQLVIQRYQREIKS